MHFLIRTGMIYIAVFLAARIIPPDATITGLELAIIIISSSVDFYLGITTSRGLLDHILNSNQNEHN